ncbi:MAG: SsrA-binding protein SmpB [Candidatus Poribacteria bacterium]|nr:SsrA-binding protein SmpB [Candidatus Poribacteria bacterium]
MARQADNDSGGIKQIVFNRKARHDYHLSDPVEAGLVLVGTEVKSLRAGKVTITDAYVHIRGNEAFLLKLHISPYDFGNMWNHEPDRPRKLLLHKNEIRKLARQIEQRGFTVVPTRMYFKNGRAKVEIALAKGKAEYDKRADMKERAADRQVRDVVRSFNER